MDNISQFSFVQSWQSALNKSAIFRAVNLVIAWLLVWQLGRLVEYTEHASVWFPAAGLTYAACLIVGARAIPSLMVAAVVITFWAGEYYGLSLTRSELAVAGVLFGIAHITPYYTASTLIAKLGNANWHSSVQLIVMFLVSSALAALLTTLLVLLVLVQTNMMEADAVSSTWLPFWIGDLAGVIVLGPIFAAILSKLHPSPRVNLEEFASPVEKPSQSYTNKILINFVLILLTMLLAYMTRQPESAFAIFFLAVTHMWIACTENPLPNVLSLAASSILIALLVHILGLMEYVMVYQFAINVVAANALFGIAVPTLVADNRKLREMVFTDSLTQVATRDHLQQRAEIEIMRSHSENRPLTMVVFDVDYFKEVNDKFGHSAGDLALKQVSAAAKNCLRPTDMIARFGGDEFVILLPNTGKSAALMIAERVQTRVSEIQIGKQQLSISSGIAQLELEEGFMTLFDHADRALYQAKKGGRNQVRLYKEHF